MWLAVLAVSIIVVVVWCLKLMYFSHKDCPVTTRLDGKLAIVTGCNTGLGLVIVGELARRGARVIMACRNMSACIQARTDLLLRYGQPVEPTGDTAYHLTPITEESLVCEHLDLSSSASIRAFARRIQEQYPHIDLLVNNAAVHLPNAQVDPGDGIEEHIRVNYLGHFMLTNLLTPCLLAEASDAEQSVSGRVVNVSSLMHRFAEFNVDTLAHPFSVGSPYSNSKLANVMHAREFSDRWFESHGLMAVSVHPGLVKTDIFRHSSFRRWMVYNLLAWLSKSPLEGAQTVLYCCLADNLQPGGYYDNCRLARVNPQALNDDACSRVWETSEHLIELWEEKEARLQSN